MKKIELVPGISSSVLGFGCAPILGSIGADKSEKAILSAIEHGVTHFDIARSYGYGEAENFVGKILKPYRRDIVLASKFGIKANNKAKLLKPLKPIIRLLREIKGEKDKKTEIDPIIKSQAKSDRFHYRVEIKPLEMKKSLEESLTALKTDYLDYFFIHEPLQKIENIGDILQAAENLKKEGKIRAFGLAFMQSQKELHSSYLKYFDILQFNNSPGIPSYDDLKVERSLKPNIFFSPINGGLNLLTPEEKLVQLNLDFPKSVILCSMFNEKHLASNAKLFL